MRRFASPDPSAFVLDEAAAAFLLVDESRDETHERLDLPGLALSSLGLWFATGLISGLHIDGPLTLVLAALLLGALAALPGATDEATRRQAAGTATDYDVLAASEFG